MAVPMSTADKLADALNALHQLNTGHLTAECRDGDFLVRYNQTTKGDLKQYIDDLRIQLAYETGIPVDPCTQRRPLQFYMGGY